MPACAGMTTFGFAGVGVVPMRIGLTWGVADFLQAYLLAIVRLGNGGTGHVGSQT
jgi:hypothetical protein